MNVSRPVASSLEGVGFGPLVAEDIRKLSVKRIVTPNTYDTLLNPIAGGLYDPALGATAARPCSTCHLDEQSCPGHCGHIDLPVWNYHCIFMDQVFRLLRAQCGYCHRLRMSRADVNLYVCQLKLLQYGLIQEATDIKDVTSQAASGLADKDGDDSDEEDGGDVIAQQNAFVKRTIRKLSKSSSVKDTSADEAVQTARRTLVANFKSEMVSGRKCASCKAAPIKFRKNRFSGIFVKPLSKKEKESNERNGISLPVNSLVALNRVREARKRQEAKRQQKRARREDADEGVADLDSSSNEEADYAQELDMLHELIPDAINDNENALSSQKDASAEGGLLDMQSMAATDRSAGENPTNADLNQERYLPANEAHASLSRLFDLESDIMGMIYPSSSSPTDAISLPPSADMFFIHCLLVPPAKYRKEARMGGDAVSEPPEHSTYKSILNASQLVWQIMKEVQGVSQRTGRPLRNFDDLQRAFVALQDCVNSLIDNTKSPIRGRAALRLPEGVKQKLEKKEGLFRMFIMGKRVNFAARTVLSPDPNLETNEIGVPPVFARTLTYPEPVTAHNFDELKQAVQNGPNKWPGASAIEYENGQVISLKRKTDEERLALANLLLAPSNSTMTGIRNKKVHRHLNNGDIVIMNRQPTLHKPSMMCHRAKVLPQEKTFRMHYANCKTYNADFDGDEMNMHFPQNEVARAEALQIADTDHQYLSATAGEPLRGLIQDHISMSVWLTCIDMFFNREEYHELLYCSIRPEDNHTSSDRILLVEPAILKPKPVWTGKQVITTILKNIKPPSHAPLFMESKSSTPRELWPDPPEEGVVRIEDGELLTGILDKKQIGPATGGIIHTVYEAYGHVAAGKLMSILGRLLTRMLNMRAFSCGVEDLILTNQGDTARKEQIKSCGSLGLSIASKYVSMEEEAPNEDDPELRTRLEAVLRDDKKQADLDVLMNSSTSALTTGITKACLPNELIRLFPKNQMQTMTASGAKGSIVNASQISCNLGQQVLEGRRVPTMVSGKTLPCFKPLDPNIRSGGYIVDRFLTGVRPQEYYFHTMAGREGLIDTAVKTSRSGYLQRCLVKGLEGLRADYDSSVRDSDGTMIQAIYGEDGLETTRKALKDFSFQAKNFLSLFASLNVRSDDKRMTNEEAIEWNSKAMKRVNKTGNIAAMDPVLARYSPASTGGSVSEMFYSDSKAYIKENPDGKLKTKDPGNKGIIPRKMFESMLRINYLKSLVPAGEAVGVVAAQSLGEPSTQMTLNTFHLAGHAAKNVTLGIPRLRDILMTARKSIPLPIMRLDPISEMSKDDCDTFARSISRLSLAELVESASVEEIVGDDKSADVRIYKIRLNLYPAEDYTQEHAIQITDVADKLETSFVPLLSLLIQKEVKKRNSAIKSSDTFPEIGKSSGRVEQQAARPEAENEGGDSDDEDDGDDDATNAKRKANLDEGLTFEDPDEDEQDIVRQGEEDAEAPEASDHEDEGYGGSESSSGSDGEGTTDGTTGKSSKKATKDSEKSREARIKDKSKSVGSFSFSEKRGDVCEVTFRYNCSDPKILLLDLVKNAADRTVIHEIEGVKSCTTSVEKDNKTQQDTYTILAAGVNIKAMHTYQELINPHTIYTNDIYQVLIHYGVEAARNLIIRELGDVFEGHSISVDHRHLTLVADYMTRNGSFQSFSRLGMKDKRSAFAKMSFETTMGFLSDAVMQGDSEDLTSPSARITMGKIGKMGSGMCDVFLPA